MTPARLASNSPMSRHSTWPPQLSGMHLGQIHRLEVVASEGHMSTEREVETPLPCS